MNGEIPSVPITTLAGISSLTDLLPEMPLPSPLQQTLSNKSLLFHPRVVEEANILLSGQDEYLAPLLVQSLLKTSAEHIELKDHLLSAPEHPVDQQQNVPELLKAILRKNPNVFAGSNNSSVPTSTQQSSTAAVPSNAQQSAPWNQQQHQQQQHHQTQQQRGAQQVQQQQQQHLPPPPPQHPVPQPHQTPPKPIISHQPQNQTPHLSPQQPPSAPLQYQLHPGLQPNHPQASQVQSQHPHYVQKPLVDLQQIQQQQLATLQQNMKLSGFNDISSLTRSSVITSEKDIPNGSVMSSPSSSSSSTVMQPNSQFSNQQDNFQPNNVNSFSSKSVHSFPNHEQFNMSSPSVISQSPKKESPNSSKLVGFDCKNNHDLKEPIILLNKMTTKDLEQMQQQLKNNHNHTIKSDSEGEDDKSSKRSFFKNRDRERRRETRATRGSNYNDAENNDSNEEDNLSMADRIKKRKREGDDEKEEPFIPPKPKLKKIERKLVPVLEFLTVEELMETNTYHRFNKTVEKIFDSMEDVNLTMDSGQDFDEDVPPEVLIPKYQLQELTSEAAKLKTLGATSSVPTDKIIRLLSILEKNIRDGARVTPLADPDDDEDEQKLWMELAMERVMRAVDSSLTVLNILTSPKMSKRVYIEDVIDRVVIFAKFQLHNTVYPAFDPVYRVNTKEKSGYSGNNRKKRQYTKEVREKSVLILYTKLSEVVGLISELLFTQTLVDTTVLHASSMGVSPFFVENISELQLSSLKLVTTIFTKYEKHRKLLLDDILASMARLPSTKRNLRTYRLNSADYIQMLTALVLQLIQCMVVLPENLGTKSDKSNAVDPDVFIASKFKAAKNTATNFLHVFLAKCSSKSEEIDYRPIFENLIQDLLVTVNKPEWPAAELMLSVLGSLLVSSIVNKSLEMTLRVASLDYLGSISARLRKDSVQSKLKLSSIDLIIRDIRIEELKDDDGNLTQEVRDVQDDDERTEFLQRVLLDYLAAQSQTESALSFARFFHITQWYQDIMNTSRPAVQKPKPQKVKKKKKRRATSSSDESSDSEDDKEDVVEESPMEGFKIQDAKKKFLLSKINAFEQGTNTNSTQTLQTYVDYQSAELIARYLGSKQNFSQSFDTYLKRIISVLMESSVLIRTKAMKCLTAIVEVDSGVLAMKEMQIGVSHSFLDQSTSVREAAVDLVGKFILSKPELIDKYYDMLSARILDTGVSVRKRVIKILKDICTEFPDYPKIPEICVKMIRRINDEESIRKLVMEVFHNMWFMPVREKPLDAKGLLQKVINITDVVHASADIGLEWFEQLLQSLFKPKEDAKDDAVVVIKHVIPEPPKQLVLACKQIVNCLIDYVVRLDGSDDKTPQKLLSCLTTLYLLAKIRPQLLIDHAITIQPYLSLRCHTMENFQVISYAAKILELVVPLIENASESFLANLESDSVKLVVTQRPSVITSSCISCLSSVVNNVTKNYKLVRDCFSQFYKYLTNFRDYHLKTPDPDQNVLKRFRDIFKKAVYVIGLLLRHFNFADPQMLGDTLPPTIKDDVLEILMYFLQHRSEYRLFIIKSIGLICIRHFELMLAPELKAMYQEILRDHYADTHIKKQVLNNIENYLSEEEKRMIQQDLEWAKLSKNENLKEMCDISSGMASTVIQVYLKEIVDSFLHPSLDVRHAVLKVIQLILNQGLLNPVQLVPYLICMSTDSEKPVSNSADKQLQDIEKKYPGFIHMKSQHGIRLSYQFQMVLQNSDIIRGFREKEGELPSALNGFLYSILKSKQQRRAVALSFLKQFDEQEKTSLEQMLFLADNMAYFPYQVQDEPLFIIHSIDVMLSVSGTNLLQSFKEALIPLQTNQEIQIDPITGRPRVVVDEDEEEDPEALLARMPEDPSTLVEIMTSSQGCLLLLVLKNHLKVMYGFNDAKVQQYSPSENSKIYEKAVTRKSNALFNPHATLKKLREKKLNTDLNEDEKKALISEFIEFKHLIMSLDPDDMDDDDDDKPPGQNTPGNLQRPQQPPADGRPLNPIASTLPQSSQYTSGSVDNRIDPMSTHGGGSQHNTNSGSHNMGSGGHNMVQGGHNMVSPSSHPLQQQPPLVSPLKVPKLTIIAPQPPSDYKQHHHKSHKTKKSEKHKKHPKKKKKHRYHSSDEDEDSENENSDPDYE